MTNLFVYGVLASEKIIDMLLGRTPASIRISLQGYQARHIHLQGWEPFPILLRSSQDAVSGIIYMHLTSREMHILDRFEAVSDGLFVLSDISELDLYNAKGYFPTAKLISSGVVGDKWGGVSDAIEYSYCCSVIPLFKKDNLDIYG